MLTGGNSRSYNRSGIRSAFIALGETDAAEIIDLGKNYAFVVIGIEDCSGFASNTKLRANVGLESPLTLYTAMEPNDPSLQWEKLLPLSGSCYLRVNGLDFTRFLEFHVDTVTIEDVRIDVWGFDGAT